jgi:hypothetical protein
MALALACAQEPSKDASIEEESAGEAPISDAEPSGEEEAVSEEEQDIGQREFEEEDEDGPSTRLPPGAQGFSEISIPARGAVPAPAGTIGEKLTLAEISAADQATIRSVIKARRSRVLDCYNKALANEPGLTGLIVVIFDIVDGHPDAIEVAGMTPALQACVKSRVMVWRFTGVKEAFGIELTYNLQPSG